MTRAVELAQVASNGVSEAFKNRIINGAMVIDQRNAGASVNNLAGALTYSVDRFPVNCSAANKFSMQQNAGSVTPPAGFSNYLGLTSTSAYTSGSTDYFHLYQPVEGYNIADLNWGTANAKTITASFWVYASVTGTYGGIVLNSSGTANYPFTYTVNSANTWEQKTITIAGATIGTWNSTNGTGLEFRFDLGTGSAYTTGTAGAWSASFGYPSGTVKFVATNGGTLYITGVQLEVGSTATSFDTRSYGTELALAQRYYLKSFEPNTAPANGAANGINSTCAAYSSGSTYVAGVYVFPAQMRAIPTVTFFGLYGATGHWDIFKSSAWAAATTTQANTPSSTQLNVFLGSSSLVAGDSYPVAGNFTASAEL